MSIKTYSIVVLAMLALSSCRVTKERCDEKFPSVALVDSTSKKETTTHKRDTTYLPGEVLIFTDTLTVPCPELEYHKEVKKGNLTSSVNISKGKIRFKCAADSLQHIVDSLMVLRETERTIINQKPPDVIKESTSFDNFCKWALLFLVVMILGWAVFKWLSRKVS